MYDNFQDIDLEQIALKNWEKPMELFNNKVCMWMLMGMCFVRVWERERDRLRKDWGRERGGKGFTWTYGQ